VVEREREKSNMVQSIYRTRGCLTIGINLMTQFHAIVAIAALPLVTCLPRLIMIDILRVELARDPSRTVHLTLSFNLMSPALTLPSSTSSVAPIALPVGCPQLRWRPATPLHRRATSHHWTRPLPMSSFYVWPIVALGNFKP
jgi:hypothetical protein